MSDIRIGSDGDYSARTRFIIGDKACDSLASYHVAVFGIGGVGSYAAESLVRCGIGEITVIDADVVDVSNINRQLFALSDNVGQDKVEVAKSRLLSVRPDVLIHPVKLFYSEETKDSVDMRVFDYVVDAIDSVDSKVFLIKSAKEAGVPIVSAMGAGNKLDPSRFEVADIYATSVCPLAKTMRKRLRQEGIESLDVVYSKEEPVTNSHPPGSISFVPPVAGMILASVVIKGLVEGLKK